MSVLIQSLPHRPIIDGLRDYGEETKVIWNGDKDCEHNWQKTKIEKSDAAVSQGPNSIILQSHTEPKKWTYSFCQKCGAWFGQLGLEPTLELYLEHLLQITAELKRVLKKTGTMWLNMGTSYSNGETKVVVKEWYD